MKHKFAIHHMNIASQSGAILVVSLLILVVLTLLGLSSAGTTVIEERMSSNQKQRAISYQSAEAALKIAEDWLASNANLNSVADLSKFNGTNGYFGTSELIWNTRKTKNWTTANSQAVTTLPSFKAASQAAIPGAPRYVIEVLGKAGRPPLKYDGYDKRPYAFRITAIGWGTDGAAKYLLSTTFKKHLD